MDFKKNTIQLDMAGYRHYWRGEEKVGKTTLWRDLIISAYGDAKFGMLLSIGQEIGYKSLDNLFVHDCPEWADFVEVVDELVENRSANEFKMLAIDTVDEIVNIAEKEVLAIHRRQKGETAQSLNAALGGYGAGKKKARQLIEEQISRLERGGYGMVYISHTRIKDITEKATDAVYQQLTGALEFAYDSIFSNRADVMAMFVTESKVSEEKLKSSERFIYFRSTNFIDAGSRVANLPDKIELSAEKYLSAINTALEKSSGISGKDAVKVRKQEEESRLAEASKISDKQKEVSELRKSMMAYVKGLTKEDKSLKIKALEEAELPVKFMEVEEMEVLLKIKEIIGA